MLTRGAGIRPAVRLPEFLAVAAVLTLALALRVPLMDRGLEYDEVWSAMEFVEADTAWQTASTFRQFNNHIFYSLAARASEGAFGRSEWALRLPALVFGLAAVLVLWLAARRRFGRLVAVGAAFALATNSVHVGFSASARGYTGLVLFTLVSSALFLRWVREDLRTAGIAAYVASGVLAVYTHLFAAAVIGVQALVLAGLSWREARRVDGPAGPTAARSRGIGLAMIAVGGLALLCYAPVLDDLVANLASGRRSAFRPRLPAQVLLYLTGWGNQPPGHLLGVAAIAGWLWAARRHGAEAALAALLFVVPIGLVAVVRPEFVRERFFVFVLPACALGYALGVDAVARTLHARWPKAPAAAAAVAIVTAVVTWASASAPWMNVPIGGFREAVAALEAPADGRRVGACAIGTGVDLYGWYASAPIFVPASVAEFDAWASRYDEVRCAYRPEGPPAHRAIAAQLDRLAGAPERHFVIRVYRYAPPGRQLAAPAGQPPGAFRR